MSQSGDNFEAHMTDPHSDPDPYKPHWPKGVRPMSWEQSEKLGVDANGHLFWDGKPVEVNQRVILTTMQKVAAVVVPIAAIFEGLGSCTQGLHATYNIGCKQ